MILRTGRLVLEPVGGRFAEGLARLKADPLIYAQMLGGVRTAVEAAAELADDIAFWGRVGTGMWAVCDLDGRLIGTTGIHERPDGRGLALRFAFDPAARGHGLARAAAGAALFHAHEAAGLRLVVAVAKETNTSSRLVLGAIGMRETGRFMRGRDEVIAFESRR